VKRVSLAVLAACADPQPPPVVLMPAGVLVPVPPPCCAGPGAVEPPVATVAPPVEPPPPVEPSMDQPPEIKLRLGHYRSGRRGIGAVIDRTGREALLRYDGTAEVLHLLPEPAPLGRTDWSVSGNHVVMQTWDDGRVVVYVDGDKDGIYLRRDGDAEPL
jgi:hypothetical protein